MMSPLKRSAVTVLGCALFASACEPRQTAPEPVREPVVVYASYAEGPYLPELFSGFTETTGIRVTLHYGESEDLTNKVISDRGSPPADVLMTRGVMDIWRAADEGALRPLVSGNLAHVSDTLRDPDGFWAASGVELAVILYTPESGDDLPATYADLAGPEYRGRVCVSTPSSSSNRSLLAMMIAESGVRPAERVVRGWVRNLAVPPLDSDSDVFDAVEDGTCDYGLVSHGVALSTTSRFGEGAATFVTPQPAYASIEGIGVARHARNPESAQLIVDWLLSDEVQRRHALGAFHYSSRDDQLKPEVSERLSRQNVAQAGWLDEDARLLAERAGYR